ncbi:hypothetical protein DS67_00865 [Mesotoga sp. SC_4PWA21]|nr:hypothetical protein DS67_00865 [Mesotoga sp. SC_4PWA21]
MNPLNAGRAVLRQPSKSKNPSSDKINRERAQSRRSLRSREKRERKKKPVRGVEASAATSISLFDMHLTKNEELILALEQRTMFFSLTAALRER